MRKRDDEDEVTRPCRQPQLRDGGERTGIDFSKSSPTQRSREKMKNWVTHLSLS